ncbi:hypothetical protein ACS0TY_000390 [Phlomoides rotata]
MYKPSPFQLESLARHEEEMQREMEGRRRKGIEEEEIQSPAYFERMEEKALKQLQRTLVPHARPCAQPVMKLRKPNPENCMKISTKKRSSSGEWFVWPALQSHFI